MHRVVIAAGAAACVLLASHAARSATADDSAALIAKHKAYVGWALADGTLRSARFTLQEAAASPEPAPKPGATPDPLGEANSTAVELRRELLYRTSVSAYGLEIGARGFTGSVFWAANVNGNTVTQRGRAAREALTQDLIDSEGLGEVPASARPDATFDGKAAAVVRIDPKTGVPADIFLDRETGGLLGYRTEPDDPVERSTVHVVSYAEFAPGKRYVSAWRVGDSKRRLTVTKFEPNVPVTDAELHPPAAHATWSFGAPATVPIDVVRVIGMLISGGRSVHVDAKVNGHVGHFLFDSGAGSTLIFNPFAKTAGVHDLGRSAYSGVNGRTVAATLARVDTFTIGGNTLHDVIVQHSSAESEKLDGIIGFDILADAVIHIDLVSKKLTISNPNGFEPEVKQGAYAFGVDLSDFHAGVPMKVEGRVLSSVWMDTGDDYFLILPGDFAKRAVPIPNFPGISFVGADGASGQEARCGRLPDAQVGPYKYRDAIACFVPNGIFGLDGGLIGFDFLRHFNWTFDYPHGRVVLTPNGE